MIKIINQRTLHEVLQEMRAQGVTLKDTEGFGINMDQSGHTYVVYMGEETETGVIDTSAGEAGLSAWYNSSNPIANPSNPIEIGEVKTSVAYGVENLTNTTGNTWTITLAGASENSNVDYIKPRTFFVQATERAPELVDNGLGGVVINDKDRRTVGTINYETGAVSITYLNNYAPTSAPTVKYDHSPLPNTSVFPKLVALSHIVFITDAGNESITYELLNNDPALLVNSKTYITPSFFNHGTNLVPNRIGNSTQFMVEDFCDSRISLQLNTTITDRKVRWMNVDLSGSTAKLLAVLVYWNRLST